MFSVVRVFIAFHAAAYLALVGLTPATNFALATPFPMSMVKNHSTSLQDEAGPRPKTPTLKAPSNSNSSHSTTIAPTRRTLLPFLMRSVYPRQDSISALISIVNSLGSHSQALGKCSDSCLGAPADQQQSSMAALLLFSDNLLGLQGCIEGTTGDEGLKFYDKNSEIEKLLREVIDIIKQCLTYVNNLCNCIPLISGLLGPTVYIIKCIIEWLIDLCQDCTDASLNALVSPLQCLLPLCGNCDELLGVCLLGL